MCMLCVLKEAMEKLEIKAALKPVAMMEMHEDGEKVIVGLGMIDDATATLTSVRQVVTPSWITAHKVVREHLEGKETEPKRNGKPAIAGGD